MRYFTVKELCVSNSHPRLVVVPAQGTTIYNNIVRLIERLLDPLRAKLGRPIKVSSGYRSDALNTAVGGSKTSAHRYGLAADIHTGNNGSDNISIVKAMLNGNIDYDQIIIEYPSFNSAGEAVSARWIHVGLSRNQNRRQLLFYHNGRYMKVNKVTEYTFRK